MLPYDCIIHGIIKYISSSEDYLKLFTLSKDIYKLITTGEYECHIFFNISYFSLYASKLRYHINLPLSVKKFSIDDALLYTIIDTKHNLGGNNIFYHIFYNEKNTKKDIDNKNSDTFNKYYYKYVVPLFPFIENKEYINNFENIKKFIDIFNEYEYNKFHISSKIDFKNISLLGDFGHRSNLLKSSSSFKIYYEDAEASIMFFNKKDKKNFVFKMDYIENIANFIIVRKNLSIFDDLSENDIVDFKKFPHYLYNSDVNIIRGVYKGAEKKYEYFHDLLIKRIPFLDLMFDIVYNVYICGSIIPLSFIPNIREIKDIDIAIPSKYIDYNVNKIIENIKKNLYIKNIKLEQKYEYKYHLSFKYKDNDYNFDFFGFTGDIENLIKRFHLPCVRAFYDVHDKGLYCYSSFVRAIYTGICYNTKLRYFMGKSNVTDIFKKYYNYGFGFVFNKKDMLLFLKNIDKENTYYEIKKVEKYIPMEEIPPLHYATKMKYRQYTVLKDDIL